MPPPAALLLAATFGSAPGRLSLSLAPPRPPPLSLRRAPPARRIRPSRIRAATAVGGEFGALGRRREFIGRLRNVLPGGRWWRLEDEEDGAAGRAEASGATAADALRRMWALVATDRWVIFLGFASLVCAMVSEIARPHLLVVHLLRTERRARLLPECQAHGSSMLEFWSVQEIHEEGVEELPIKAKFLFGAATEAWDAEFYVKVYKNSNLGLDKQWCEPERCNFGDSDMSSRNLGLRCPRAKVVCLDDN